MTQPTISFRAAEIAAADLASKPLGQPSAEPLTGEIMTRAKVFLDNPTVTAGTWECEPGASRWEFTTRGEVIYVLSGRMTVHQDGDDPVELTAGSSCIFPIGWKGTWTVHETLRKVFVVYREK
ncbi:MAG: cupin domain-containing protein [Acidimicrobiaceae bacterium]